MPTTTAEWVSREVPARVLSDRELVARFLETREETSFAEIVSRHGNLVMSVAWRVLRDRHAAEDAFQATFLVLAEHVQAIRNRESLATWLHGTAFRVAHKALATTKRRRECVMPAEPTADPPGDQSARHEQQLILDEELARLPESVRGPLVLHYLQDRSAPQIAEELGMTLQAVEGRLKRGRKALRVRLLRRGVLLSAVIATVEGSAACAPAAVTAPLIQLTAQACTASVLSAPLPVSISLTATQLAARELIAMSKIALMKTALMWGGVAGVMTLTGVAATGDWLGHAATQSGANSGSGTSAETPTGLLDDAAGDHPAGEIVTTSNEVPVGGSGLGSIAQAGGSGGGFLGGLFGGGGADAGGGTSSEGGFSGAAAGPGPGASGGSLGGSGGPPMVGGGMGMGGAGMMAPPPSSKVVDYKRRSANEQRIRQALTQPVNLQFVGQTLESALQIMEQDFRFTIRLDTAALQESGVGPETEINLVIEGVSLESAIDMLLENINGVELDYVIKNEVMKITTAEKARELLETRVYDVRNFGALTPAVLARVIERTVEPQSWMANVEQGRNENSPTDPATMNPMGSGGMAGMMSGPGMMGGGMPAGGGASVAAMVGRGMMAGQPGSMAMISGLGGGAEGTAAGPGPAVDRQKGQGWIEAIDGALVITQSQPVHREIVALLEQLADHAQGAASSGMGGMMMPGMPGMGGQAGFNGGPGMGAYPGANVPIGSSGTGAPAGGGYPGAAGPYGGGAADPAPGNPPAGAGSSAGGNYGSGGSAPLTPGTESGATR